MSFWKIQSDIFGKSSFEVTIELLKRHIKSRHNSRFVFSFRYKVVLGVVKFEIDDLINFLRILISKIIKGVEVVGIVLKLHIFCFRRHKVSIVPSIIFKSARSTKRYMSFT